MSRLQLLAATALLTVFAWHGPAEAQPVSGLYIGAGGGANFMQQEQLRTSPVPGQGPLYGHGSFKTGYVGLGSVGWGFGNGLRIEAEGNYRANDFQSGSGNFAAGGRERKYGPMANVMFDLDIGSPYVFPYIGAGVGYQWVDTTTTAAAGPYAVRVNGSDGSPAYQAIAGLSFPVPPVVGLSVTAEYRYFALLDDRTVPATFVSAGGAASGSVKVHSDVNHSLLLGLRYAFDVAPPPPATAAVTPPPAAEPTRSYLVFFDWDRADLTPRARQVVAAAAQATTRVQVTRIEVNGYTDTSGTVRYNQGLSLRRASSVAAELVRDGVPRPAISIEGFGETHLLVATGPGVREPQNRRVEIILH